MLWLYFKVLEQVLKSKKKSKNVFSSFFHRESGAIRYLWILRKIILYNIRCSDMNCIICICISNCIVICICGDFVFILYFVSWMLIQITCNQRCMWFCCVLYSVLGFTAAAGHSFLWGLK